MRPYIPWFVLSVTYCCFADRMERMEDYFDVHYESCKDRDLDTLLLGNFDLIDAGRASLLDLRHAPSILNNISGEEEDDLLEEGVDKRKEEEGRTGKEKEDLETRKKEREERKEKRSERSIEIENVLHNAGEAFGTLKQADLPVVGWPQGHSTKISKASTSLREVDEWFNRALADKPFLACGSKAYQPAYFARQLDPGAPSVLTMQGQRAL